MKHEDYITKALKIHTDNFRTFRTDFDHISLREMAAIIPAVDELLTELNQKFEEISRKKSNRKQRDSKHFESPGWIEQTRIQQEAWIKEMREYEDISKVWIKNEYGLMNSIFRYNHYQISVRTGREGGYGSRYKGQITVKEFKLDKELKRYMWKQIHTEFAQNTKSEWLSGDTKNKAAILCAIIRLDGPKKCDFCQNVGPIFLQQRGTKYCEKCAKIHKNKLRQDPNLWFWNAEKLAELD
jgi:hypothetical protein